LLAKTGVKKTREMDAIFIGKLNLSFIGGAALFFQHPHLAIRQLWRHAHGEVGLRVSLE
jgi:hypothetical protein